jgi:hypothetical protein
MNDLKRYILDTIGLKIEVKPLPKQQADRLPVYLTDMYGLFTMTLLEHFFLVVNVRQPKELSILQTTKHLTILRTALGKKVILLLHDLNSINRKRLLEKGVNFIVPGKQMFLPDLLIDLREQFADTRGKGKKETLLPSAQFLLIYHILHRQENHWRLEEYSFKEIAQRTGYTAMAITKAVENLKHLELIDVKGEKEKFIRFRGERNELWRTAVHNKILVNPVIKRVFVDAKPKHSLLHSNTSALPEYSDMNPGNQQFFAIDKNAFYLLEQNNELINANDHEGQYCLEVWKYNPEKLVEELPFDMLPVVDPLSLYLTLRDTTDERIEMALNKIIEDHIW